MLMDIGLFSVWGNFRESPCGCFVYVFGWWFVLIFLGCMSGMGIAESQTGVGLLQQLLTVWQSNCSNFHCHLSYLGVPVAPLVLYLACHPKVDIFDMIGPQTLFSMYLSGSSQESRNHSRHFNQGSLMQGFGHTGDGNAEKRQSVTTGKPLPLLNQRDGEMSDTHIRSLGHPAVELESQQGHLERARDTIEIQLLLEKATKGRNSPAVQWLGYHASIARAGVQFLFGN